MAGLVDLASAPVVSFFDELGSTVLLAIQTAAWAARPPFRLGQLLGSLEFVGVGSAFIVGLVGLFTGMAFTVSTIIGFRQFSAEGMVGGVVALALARELAPVLAAVVVCARAGSTMASELGNMRVSEQIDAITTMGVSPVQYLVAPRVVAATLVLPFLATFFGLAGQTGAYLVAVVWQGIDPGIFFDRIQTFMRVSDLRMMVVKATVLWLPSQRHLLQEGVQRFGRRSGRRRGDRQGRGHEHRGHLCRRLRLDDAIDGTVSRRWKCFFAARLAEAIADTIRTLRATEIAWP